MQEPDGRQGQYRKSLGVLGLVSLGIGGTIGSGIFVVPGIAAGISGPYSLFAWLIVAFSATCVLLSLAWTSSVYRTTGAFYGIFRHVFGARVSTVLVITYTVSSIFGIATIAAGLGQYFAFFGVGNPLLLEFLILGAFCLVNLWGIYFSSMTENILTLIKVVPLVIITILLIPFIHIGNLTPLQAIAPLGILQTIIIVYWPFTGFEICAIPAGETKDPGAIARSLIIVQICVVSIYFFLNLALIGSVGSAVLAASPAPVATAAGLVFGQAEYVVGGIGIIAMISAINAYMVGTSRVIQNLGEEHRIPLFGQITARGVPGIALVISALLSGALLLFSNQFNTLAGIAVITTLIPYIFICAAALVLSTERRIRAVAFAGSLSTAGILIAYFLS
ncbi:MAG: APC family permease [Methanomicrobiales archaeon]|nr:APC family permease [Methanomicrobiales archaeon]